jgi:RNA polymerase sigma-70 factor (ECF subfamily)
VGVVSPSGTAVDRDRAVAVAAEDARLAVAARTDPRAFLPLYDRYHRSVYQFCYARLGTVEAAEDAAQETFVKALAGVHAYRGDSFAAWLFRIAQHVVADLHRWQRRHPAQLLERAAQEPDRAETPEGAAVRHAAQQEVRAALAALPPEQRLAVECHLAGLTDAQTAALLERSTGAVKMLRYRALQQLRRHWQHADRPGTEAPDG